MRKEWEDNFDDDSFEVLGDVDSSRMNRNVPRSNGRIHLKRGEIFDVDLRRKYYSMSPECDDRERYEIEDSVQYSAPPKRSMASKNPDLIVISIKRRRRYRISLLRIFIFILIIGIIIYLICLLFKGGEETKAYRMDDTSITSVRQSDANISYAAVQDVEASEIADPLDDGEIVDRVPVIHDSMNDVDFKLYPVEKLVASVAFDMPSVNDDYAIVTAAADYRADNGEIVGEFIKDGKSISSGTSKAGWCYVSKDGAITIGAGSGDEVKSDALDEGGCFFRQFPLVMDGEVVPNDLKGKSFRRALGFYKGEPYIIRSDEKESVFDFSQALADYGFSHAIYLPGGEGKWMSQTSEGTEIHNEHLPQTPYATYLIFKTR